MQNVNKSSLVVLAVVVSVATFGGGVVGFLGASSVLAVLAQK